MTELVTATLRYQDELQGSCSVTRDPIFLWMKCKALYELVTASLRYQ